MEHKMKECLQNGGMAVRGVHSAVDEIRRSVFTEIAKLAYEGGDYTRVDRIPYKILPGEIAHHRHDIFVNAADAPYGIFVQRLYLCCA